MIDRRALLALLGGAAAAPALGQPARPVVAVLMAVDTDPDAYLRTFREGLRALGYIEGQSVTIEVHKAKPDQSDLAVLAAELVRRKVDVIVPIFTQAAFAAKTATREIPITAYAGDLVSSGLVQSPCPSRRQHHRHLGNIQRGQHSGPRSDPSNRARAAIDLG